MSSFGRVAWLWLLCGVAATRLLTSLINDARARNGLPSLCEELRLARCAAIHCSEMRVMRRMTHDTPDRTTLADRASRLGIRWRVLGENVAFGQQSESEVFRDWMRSPEHRANILHPSFNSCGSHLEEGYWSLEFGLLLDARCGQEWPLQ